MSAPKKIPAIPAPLRLPGWLWVAVIGRNWKLTLARLTIFVVTAFVVFRFILLPVRVEGISMLPTCGTVR